MGGWSGRIASFPTPAKAPAQGRTTVQLSPMHRLVPNALTAVRLFLAGVFFVMLSWYQYQGRGDPTLLNLALAVYLLALFTDFLDGYLARRWKAESAFGRVVDPFV